MQTNDLNINLMVIGDSNVGKSNLCSRFVKNEFNENLNPTIAADLFNKNILIN